MPGSIAQIAMQMYIYNFTWLAWIMSSFLAIGYVTAVNPM